MAHGGARPGAGRPQGATAKKTQEIAAKAANEGITPLEVSLSLMRHYWEKATDAAGKIIDESLAEKADAAGERAKPYIHPRLSAVAHSGPNGGPIDFRISHAKDSLTRKLIAFEPDASEEADRVVN